MAALIDHERTGTDFDLIRAEVIDHLCRVHVIHTVFSRSTDIHRPHTRGGGVQDHQLALGFLGQFHRFRQNRSAIRFAQGTLADHNHRRLL